MPPGDEVKEGSQQMTDKVAGRHEVGGGARLAMRRDGEGARETASGGAGGRWHARACVRVREGVSERLWAGGCEAQWKGGAPLFPSCERGAIVERGIRQDAEKAYEGTECTVGEGVRSDRAQGGRRRTKGQSAGGEKAYEATGRRIRQGAGRDVAKRAWCGAS